LKKIAASLRRIGVYVRIRQARHVKYRRGDKMRRIVVTALFLFGGIASADVNCSSSFNTQGILGQAASTTGCLRAADGELQPDPGPTAWGDFFVAWNITLSGSVYTYNYTVSDPGSPQKDLSHFLLGLSSSCTTATTSNTQGSNCIWAASSTLEGVDTWGDEGNSNPGIPNAFWSIKFSGDNVDNGSETVSFKSTRAPVWQDFYAKSGTYSGGNTYVYNAGFGHTGTNWYVAAPDTSTATPEPRFYGLLLACMGAAYAAFTRRRSA
jgi:hypothetical protein